MNKKNSRCVKGTAHPAENSTWWDIPEPSCRLSHGILEEWGCVGRPAFTQLCGPSGRAEIK